MKKKCLLVLVSIVIFGCASYDHVRPGANGIHRVVIRGEDKQSVESEAIREANNYCNEFEKMAAFTSEDTKYTGSIDESTHKTIKKASTAASVGGGMMGVLGGKKEKNVGQGLFGLGAVGSAVLDGDFLEKKLTHKEFFPGNCSLFATVFRH